MGGSHGVQTPLSGKKEKFFPLNIFNIISENTLFEHVCNEKQLC